jgi:hypothetical protein
MSIQFQLKEKQRSEILYWACNCASEYTYSTIRKGEIAYSNNDKSVKVDLDPDLFSGDEKEIIGTIYFYKYHDKEKVYEVLAYTRFVICNRIPNATTGSKITESVITASEQARAYGSCVITSKTHALTNAPEYNATRVVSENEEEEIAKTAKKIFDKAGMRYPTGDAFKDTYVTDRDETCACFPFHYYFYKSLTYTQPSQKAINNILERITTLFIKHTEKTEHAKPRNNYKPHMLANVLTFIQARLLPYKADATDCYSTLCASPDASKAQADCEDKTAFVCYFFRMFQLYTGKDAFVHKLSTTAQDYMICPILVTVVTDGEFKHNNVKVGVHAVAILIPENSIQSKGKGWACDDTQQWMLVDGMYNTGAHEDDKNKHDYITSDLGNDTYTPLQSACVNPDKKSDFGYGDVVIMAVLEHRLFNTFVITDTMGNAINFRDIFVEKETTYIVATPIFEQKYTDTSKARALQDQYRQTTESVMCLQNMFLSE